MEGELMIHEGDDEPFLVHLKPIFTTMLLTTDFRPLWINGMKVEKQGQGKLYKCDHDGLGTQDESIVRAW
jgi:hypothetical protein